MAITPYCDGDCRVLDYPGHHMPPEPAEYCDGDPVPHSDLCVQHGGETDLECFVEQWDEWQDEPCDCVTRLLVPGTPHYQLREAYVNARRT